LYGDEKKECMEGYLRWTWGSS